MTERPDEIELIARLEEMLHGQQRAPNSEIKTVVSQIPELQNLRQISQGRLLALLINIDGKAANDVRALLGTAAGPVVPKPEEIDLHSFAEVSAQLNQAIDHLKPETTAQMTGEIIRLLHDPIKRKSRAVAFSELFVAMFERKDRIHGPDFDTLIIALYQQTNRTNREVILSAIKKAHEAGTLYEHSSIITQFVCDGETPFSFLDQPSSVPATPIKTIPTTTKPATPFVKHYKETDFSRPAQLYNLGIILGPEVSTQTVEKLVSQLVASNTQKRYKAVTRNFILLRNDENAARMDGYFERNYRANRKRYQKWTLETIRKAYEAGEYKNASPALVELEHQGEKPFAFLAGEALQAKNSNQPERELVAQAYPA